jgi:tetratricopeptide (TPR) repeat protein
LAFEIANLFESEGDSLNAKDYFERAISLCGSYSEAIARLAGLYFDEGEFNSAESMLRAALIYSPQNVLANQILSTILQNRGDMIGASQLMINIAQHFLSNDDYKIAYTYFLSARMLNPQNALTHLGICECEIGQKNWHLALTENEAAMTADHFYNPVYRSRYEFINKMIQEEERGAIAIG